MHRARPQVVEAGGSRRRLIRAALLMLVPLLTLVPARGADAAMCIQLRIAPATLRVGDPAELELRTFAPIYDSQGALTLEPHGFPAYPFGVRAVASGGRSFPISLVPSGDSGLLTGGFTFPQAGDWEIQVVNFEPEGGVLGPIDPACYARLRFQVEALDGSTHRSSNGLSFPILMTMILSAIAVALVFVVMVHRRRSSTSRASN